MNDERANDARARRADPGSMPGTARRFRAGLALSLLLYAALLANPASAAEDAAVRGPAPVSEQDPATTGSRPGPAPATGAGAPGVPDSQSGEPSGPSPEVFVPSEEISEDFTVSFPIDI